MEASHIKFFIPETSTEGGTSTTTEIIHPTSSVPMHELEKYDADASHELGINLSFNDREA